MFKIIKMHAIMLKDVNKYLKIIPAMSHMSETKQHFNQASHDIKII